MEILPDLVTLLKTLKQRRIKTNRKSRDEPDWARRPGPKSQVALSKGKARAHPAEFKKSHTKLFSRLESKDKI